MAGPAFRPGPASDAAFTRAVAWSVTLHVLIVIVALVVPRDWIVTQREKPNLMTISLGGTPGPKTTGTTPVGGRAVERVAPPEKRPEPIRPTPKADIAAVPVKTPPRAESPKEVATIKSTPAPTRMPTTGAQVVAGITPVDTGGRGQNVGLMSSGGGSGGDPDLANFCCPEYLQQLLATIDGNWQKNQPERGTTVLKFVIHRDGSIGDVLVEQSSGSGPLDRVARAALLESRLQRLPKEYGKDTLTIHLKFPYGTP